ncbi:flagellar biosynthetic protein FliO [Massilia sp. BJB1822]|uniref:flagellar biosynthetic protein FliO n=1 Tax=Massilia sp. BJB1822 TaxID=2744470 RepID=UPI00159413C5|nr:flagellar biosynthetic protein FliO [Massilia sp. BJB1822]NVE01852.1 flagellar biosynthetic protein FliO [Massilia sp. BJB1822]
MKQWLRRVALAGCGLAAWLTAHAEPAAGQAIPFKREGAVQASAVSGAGVGLLLIALLAIGAVLLLRRRWQPGPRQEGGGSLLRVLETRRLGPRALLSVVEFAGQRYLLAQTEQGVSCVASAPLEGAPKAAEDGADAP